MSPVLCGQAPHMVGVPLRGGQLHPHPAAQIVLQPRGPCQRAQAAQVHRAVRPAQAPASQQQVEVLRLACMGT